MPATLMGSGGGSDSAQHVRRTVVEGASLTGFHPTAPREAPELTRRAEGLSMRSARLPDALFRAGSAAPRHADFVSIHPGIADSDDPIGHARVTLPTEFVDTLRSLSPLSPSTPRDSSVIEREALTRRSLQMVLSVSMSLSTTTL
jgi:hypothetical protein